MLLSHSSHSHLAWTIATNIEYDMGHTVIRRRRETIAFIYLVGWNERLTLCVCCLFVGFFCFFFIILFWVYYVLEYGSESMEFRLFSSRVNRPRKISLKYSTSAIVLFYFVLVVVVFFIIWCRMWILCNKCGRHHSNGNNNNSNQNSNNFLFFKNFQ